MKMKKWLTGLLLAVAGLLVNSAWAWNNQYNAVASSSVSSASTGSGKVYADKSSSEPVSNYTTGTTTCDDYESTTTRGGTISSGKFYLHALASFGSKFAGWSTTDGSTSYVSTDALYSPSVTASTERNAAQENPFYAVFTTVASDSVKDIYLAYQSDNPDSVTLYFYNSAGKQYWSAAVNGTIRSSTSATGNYAKYEFSQAVSTGANDFNVTVTANSAGSGYDELTVQDYQGNVYHYRIHVSEARTMYERASLDLTATSSLDGEWILTYDGTGKLTASPTSASSGSSFTTTVTAAANVSGTTTITIGNYDEGTTTGARGVEYTYAITINELPQVAHYAKVTANVADEGGKAYVGLSSTEAALSYVASETSVTTSAKSKETTVSVGNFWLFAFPEFGYKCTGWGKDTSSAKVSLAYAHNTSAITVNSSSTSSSSPVTEKYFAHFTSTGVTVKDIYLCVGDKVQLNFYNSNLSLWSARVNSTWLTDATATSGGYATYTRSLASMTEYRNFNMVVTATTASGDDCDKLTIQDYQGNVYHYRIHVSAARELLRGRSATWTVNSIFSSAWVVSAQSDNSTLTATVSPVGTATDTATVTFSPLKESTTAVTVTVSNFADGATTGPQGATYTLTATISDPPTVTFYARVDTAVVGASGESIGQGWAYASNKRTENSDIYQTTTSHSELGKGETYDESATSAEVGGFYIFAFPNLGYKFTGWSLDDPNGEIVSTTAYHMAPISVTSSSKDSANPTVVTYYAHFERDDSTVQDITLAVGDKVRLSWYNQVADTWSLQVVYMNGSSEVVVNLDDTAAHAGGYANFTRSATVESNVSEFNMLVEATKASGSDFDQLTIEDYAGNVYHYRVHVIDRRYVEAHTTISFPVASHASKVWSKADEVGSAVTVSVSPAAPTNAATVYVTGVAKSATTFTISNYASDTVTGPLGANYTFAMSVIEPWPVEFCQGDLVVIYYHNTVAKNWYMLMNGKRVEANVAGVGTQMSVTLKAQNPNTDSEILGTTPTVGDGQSSDLVVITDGENFYPYRMSVKPRRVIDVGETVRMTCSTVATMPWRIQVPDSAARYVDTAFYPDLNGGHSASVDITGKNPGKNVTIYVANFNRDDQEVNAQGAYYALVTDVIGASTRAVYMSRGTEVTWGEYYIDYTNGMSFTVSPAKDNEMSAAIASNDAATVFTTLSVPTNATNYAKALFTVKDNGGADVVKYDVMAYSWMSMYVGQEAPGCLAGSTVPWVVQSSDPEKFYAAPTVYNDLYSAHVDALAPGDFSLWATNASDAVSWYVIRAKVYDEVERHISIPLDFTTNIVISAEEGLESVWSAATGCSHITATLDNSTTPTNAVTLTLAGGTTEGTHEIDVTSDYHHEMIHVYVGAQPGQEVIYAGAVTSTVPNKIKLPAECVSAAWTASVDERGAECFHLLATSGSAGTLVEIMCDKVGNGDVMVKTDTAIYVYDVVVNKTESGDLSHITVGVGYTVTTNLSQFASELTGATMVKSPDSLIATAYVVGDTLTVNGVQDGTTTMQLATDDYIYTIEIRVHERKIRKNITLYIGDDGSATTYSYTFDQLLSYVNYAPDRVTVTTNGTTVTITPVAAGIAGVDVECFVEGCDESSTLIYQVTIIQARSGYTVRNYGEGYIAYRDADAIREIGSDLVFVFTNVEAAGSLIIPDGYTARMDILAVGGGGGGGSVATGFGRGGGGGGAGGFVSITNRKMVAGTFGVSVGAGGLGLSSAIVSGQSMPGSNGGASVFTNSFGYVIAHGEGGGGGGAPALSGYSGLDGGCGGGGSWVSTNDDGEVSFVPGRGGIGITGQGCDGGTPTETNCGGGGGGAGGNGGSGQKSGDGKYSDISGVNTLYSYGGYGGRSDKSTPAANGDGPGFGGDGGNGGPGGDGGNGTVVLRFKQLKQNVLVPIPTTNDLITARFVWQEGTNCVPFNYYGRSYRSSSDSHAYTWEQTIKSVTGTTNVVCELGGEGGTNKLGIGYYNFRIELNDGFAWDDGTSYGDTEKLSYRWVIVDKWEDIDADIAVNKTVWWSDKSNATVRVNSVSSPETSGGGVPKVLFLGSACGAHGFSSEVLCAALNAVTAVGDIDYYLFNRTFDQTGTSAYYGEDKDPVIQGSLSKGMTTNGTFYARNPNDSDKLVALENSSGNHGTMYGFYKQIYMAITNGTAKTYDYIIFSFDRTRLVERFQGAFEHEAEVAAFLKSFYADEKVIWLVDSQGDDLPPASTTTPMTPWYPCIMTQYNGAYWETIDQGVSYWGTSSTGPFKNMYDWVQDGSLGYVPYNALVGLMSPTNYPVSLVTYTNNKVTGKTGSVAWTSDDLAKMAATACPGIENQCVYDNADRVANLIADKVKVKPYNLYYRDKIVSPAEGLTIQSVAIYATQKGDGTKGSTNEADWVQIMHWDRSTETFTYDDVTHASGIPGGWMAVDLTTNLVTAVFSNIDFKVYARYDTHVLDAEGKFQTSDGANYNESTGQYEKNPNEGVAYMSMINELGIGIGVEGDADTEVPWRYTAYKITGSAQNGSIYVAGTQYSTLSCAEGRDVTVYYRGNGGYRLVALRVDGRDIEVGGAYDNYYTFKNLDTDHTISAVYAAYYGTVTPCASTNEYDGAAHVPEVDLEGWDATYATQLRYSLSEDGSYYTEEEFVEMYSTNREITCVGEHTVYCRVYAFQEGYGDSFDEPGWVWVDTRVIEAGTVTITPKPLVITANSFKLDADEAPKTPPLNQWRGVSVSGLVEGDTVNTNDSYLTWSCPDYQYAIAQYRVDPVKVGSVTDYDVAGTNYVVYYRPGVLSVIHAPMIIGGITQSGFLDPEDPYVNTGVDRVEKVYDGVATNLVIRIDDPTGEELEQITIKYSTDDGKTWTTTSPTRLNVGTNKVWYAVEYGEDQEKGMYFWVTNYNYIIVDPRPLEITAASAEKRYDTYALTTNGYDITSGSLADNERISRITVSGSQTDVGTNANVASGVRIRNDAAAEFRTSDYAITYVDGTLTVTPGAITIGDTTYIPGSYVEYGKTGVEDVEKIYDGIGTNILVNVVTPSSDYRVYYTTNSMKDADIVWSETIAFTNVGTNVVYFLVEAENYAPVTNFARVVIKPRPLTVTVFDTMVRKGGTPVYSYVVTDDITGEVVSQEILDQLEFSIAPTNSEWSSTLGDYDIVASGDAVQGNYSLTYVPGTLTVHDKNEIMYTAPNVTVPYDGQGHSNLVTVTSTDVPGLQPVMYSLSADGPWSETPPVITNVTSGTPVYYRVESTDNTYLDYSGVMLMTITPLSATVTAGDVWKWELDPTPELTATVSGILAGEENIPDLITYSLTTDGDESVGVHAVIPSGAAKQGNYTVNYVNGTIEIRMWMYPAGPNDEMIPIDKLWIATNSPTALSTNRYVYASNYVFSQGKNGMTNWMNYVLGLEPLNVDSVIYVDIEQNLEAVTNPTLIARGAKVRPMNIGALTNVMFRLIKCPNTPTGTYEKVSDTTDGRFPQVNVPIEFFRVDTRFLFEQSK